ncbi:unnamed protein product [Nezara viridula]|uniref:Uncharacterized protein n=1 Tax=Nezara viridula TaxID=85310 RepID=A0A9P0HBL9_NEZVI|nr:unnamed protein product [Nezara viridula]
MTTPVEQELNAPHQDIVNLFQSDFLLCPFQSTETSGLAPDDGIVGGPRTPQQIAAQKRLQQTQAQVDEV